MKTGDAEIDAMHNEMLGDIPRVKSITVSRGFIPESCFFLRRRADRCQQASETSAAEPMRRLSLTGIIGVMLGLMLCAGFGMVAWDVRSNLASLMLACLALALAIFGTLIATGNLRQE